MNRTLKGGVSFTVIVEPDGTTWVEIRREADDELLALVDWSCTTELLEDFVDRWLADKLADLPPARRCSSCGIAVQIVNPWRRCDTPNAAIEVDVGAGPVDHDRYENYNRVVICNRCRRQLATNHPWLAKLLEFTRYRIR